MRATTLLAFLPLATSFPIHIFSRQTTCATGVHIIAARGSTEDPGEGKVQPLSALIEAGISGSDDVAVDYPADLIDYPISETEGVTNMLSQIQSYVAACPDANIVLAGFSQGAQIVGDVLGGGSYGDPPSAPLAEQYRQNIFAALQFGDPAHVKGKSYDIGNGTRNGIFSRDDTTQLDTYASILQSYCDDGDPFCDDGLDEDVHGNEVPANQNAASQFVIAMAQAAGIA